MVCEKISTVIIILTVNAIVFLTFGCFIYCLVKFPGFRNKVLEAIEDGDNVANTEDAKKAVMLFFAIVFGVLLIDIILLQFFYNQYNLSITACVLGAFLGLLGLRKYT